MITFEHNRWESYIKTQQMGQLLQNTVDGQLLQDKVDRTIA